MKKFGLLFLSLFIASFAFAQNENETEGSTMVQPVRPPVETPWKQVDIGEFSDPVPYPPERQADIMYYNIIWRTIDLREKMNHPLYFPTEQRGTWRSLAQVIFDAIDLQDPENPNSLPVYQDEFCTTPYSKDEIKGALVQIRRIPQIDPETGETIDEMEIEEAHEAKDVLSYNLREIWFFDKQSSTYKVRILSLEPIVEYEKPNESSYQEETGDTEYVAAVLTKKKLGYIYYDELRPYLAKQEVFNVKNNAQRLSLDDVLTWKREFASYIYAEQNVYTDRTIPDYIVNARDQRIESERITERLRVFESDLWEF